VKSLRATCVWAGDGESTQWLEGWAWRGELCGRRVVGRDTQGDVMGDGGVRERETRTHKCFLVC